MMKIAIDVHGTIDARPRFFSVLTRLLKLLGVEIHVTTGVPDTLVLRQQLNGWGIRYDHVFSITDFHRSLGTYIEWDEKGHPHIDDILWDPSKAFYCQANKINLAIDDSQAYKQYFSTPYLLWRWK